MFVYHALTTTDNGMRCHKQRPVSVLQCREALAAGDLTAAWNSNDSTLRGATCFTGADQAPRALTPIQTLNLSEEFGHNKEKYGGACGIQPCRPCRARGGGRKKETVAGTETQSARSMPTAVIGWMMQHSCGFLC